MKNSSEISNGVNNKAFSKIGILIILVILIGGAIAAWQYLIGQKEEITPPEGEEIIPLEDETADWQTYRNEEYGFEVKYLPGENIIYEGATEFGLQPLKVDFTSFKIIVWRNSQKLGIKDYFLGESACGQNKSICGYLSSGYPMESVEIGDEDWLTTKKSNVVRSEFFVVSPSKEYIIELFNSWPTEEKKTATFNQVLSTFRFLE